MSNIYGDGSAGSFAASEVNNELLLINLQFTDFYVPEDVHLYVPSGTVIRASGTVAIAGTINVMYFAGGGASEYRVNANPGASCRASVSSAFGPKNTYLPGGAGGDGMKSAMPITSKVIFGAAGGGGGSGYGGVTQSQSGAGNGGGTIRIIAQGEIAIGGSIVANGQYASGGSAGAGGGGGGIIIIASATKIAIAGAISAKGGEGMSSSTLYCAGAGGGGGGGIIHLLSPEIVNIGAVSVAGGSAGANSENAGDSYTWHSGGGGGGCFGNGGGGGDLLASGQAIAAQPGEEGLFLQTETDPTSLFL